MTVLATLIVLGVLIFVHELGHFAAARSVGIRVERFSIGLGPRVFGFQRGETEYVISAIPLGGYVKMGGMDDEMMEAIEGGAKVGGGDPPPGPRPGDYDSKPVWARAWVISAGVIMNMLFALLTYTVVAGVWGSPETETTRIGLVELSSLPSGAEGLAGIPLGAELVRIGDREVAHWGEVRNALLDLPAGPTRIDHVDPAGSVEIRLPQGEEARVELVRSIDFWVLPVISSVEPGSPAANAGIEPGDQVIAIDGEAVETWSELVRAIQARPDQPTELRILREGGPLTRTVTPAEGQGQDPSTGEMRPVGLIGVGGQFPGVVYTRIPIGSAVSAGWNETVFFSGVILGFLRDLVTGQISPRSLGSIVTIGEFSGQAAAEGMPVFLRFMAFFSINLAILNLLPIPVLDGGHLVFLSIEAIRGRPVSVQQRIRWSQVGFVVLIGIMVLALGNDFLRLFGL